MVDLFGAILFGADKLQWNRGERFSSMHWNVSNSSPTVSSISLATNPHVRLISSLGFLCIPQWIRLNILLSRFCWLLCRRDTFSGNEVEEGNGKPEQGFDLYWKWVKICAVMWNGTRNYPKKKHVCHTSHYKTPAKWNFALFLGNSSQINEIERHKKTSVSGLPCYLNFSMK